MESQRKGVTSNFPALLRPRGDSGVSSTPRDSRGSRGLEPPPTHTEAGSQSPSGISHDSAMAPHPGALG